MTSFAVCVKMNHTALILEQIVKIWLCIVGLIISSVAIAGQPNGVYQHSGDTLQKLYAELHYLNQAGREIHAKYDAKIAEDPIQSRYCLGEYGYIGSRARATIGIANRIESPNKETYIQTGWSAYQCIQCSGDVAECDAIPATLELIKEEYKALHQQ